MLGEVVPALAAEQSADLHHAHIVVGVAEPENLDRAPAIVEHVGGDGEPAGEQPPAPAPVQKRERHIPGGRRPPAAASVEILELPARAAAHPGFFSFQAFQRALVAVLQRASGRIVTTMKLIGEHKEIAGQLVRYGLTGGLSSFVNIGVYWVLAAQGMDPNLAWTIGFLAAVMTGYVVHSRW